MVANAFHPVSPHPEPRPDPHLFEFGFHRRHDLVIHGGQDPLEEIGDDHLDAEGGEGRGELDANRPGAHHEQPVGHAVQSEHLVGVAYPGVVEGNPIGMMRPRAGGDHHRRGFDQSRPVGAVDLDLSIVGESSGSTNPHDSTVADRPRGDLLEERAHLLGSLCDALYCDLRRCLQRDLVHVSVAEPGQVESRFPQSLGGSSSGGCHGPSRRRTLHHGDRAAKSGGQFGGRLASRARADDYQIETGGHRVDPNDVASPPTGEGVGRASQRSGLEAGQDLGYAEVSVVTLPSGLRMVGEHLPRLMLHLGPGEVVVPAPALVVHQDP